MLSCCGCPSAREAAGPEEVQAAGLGDVPGLSFPADNVGNNADQLLQTTINPCTHNQDVGDWVRLGGAELEEALGREWIKLVRADWLVKRANRDDGGDGVLMRRQDMPPEAFIGLDELKQAGSAKLYTTEWLRVIVLSYPWLQPSHPDPHGENLRLLAKVLTRFLGDERSYYNGSKPYGVFIDFTALSQIPRSKEEERVFRLTLPALNVFYSHPQTLVLKLTGLPADYPHDVRFPYVLPDGANTMEYAERGWCFAESSMASLAKSSDKVLDLGCFRDRGGLADVILSCRAGRDPPLPPSTFGEELDKRTFANKKEDFETVNKLYSAAFELRLGKATELHFDGLGWDEGALRQLLEALESSRSLQLLDLNYNPIGDEGAEALAAALESNRARSLQTLQLCGNRIEDRGAVALGRALKSGCLLRTLELTQNRVGDVGVQALGQALESGCSLRTLELSYNSVEDRGAKALGQALKSESCLLQKLDLRCNKFGDDGALAFVEALEKSSVLRALDCACTGAGLGRLAGRQHAAGAV